MNRLLKILAAVIGLIALLIIIAIVLIISFVNPNRFKPLIIKQVYTETGRTLTMPGNISWSFFPTISIKTDSVTLSNPKGYTQPVFVHADSAKAEVRLLPLLSGNVEPKTIILSGAKLYLIKNKLGQANWSQWSPTPSAQTTSNTPTTQASTSASSFNIVIPDIDISHANIQYLDETSHQAFTLNNLNLQAKDVHFNAPFPLAFSTDFSSKNPNIRAHLNINATVMFDKKSLTANNISLTGKFAAEQTNNKMVSVALSGNASFGNDRFNLQPMNLQIANLNTTGYLTLSSINKMQYNGSVTMKPFNACDFLESFNIQTTCKTSNLLQELGFTTVFSGSQNTLNVSSFNANLDKGSVSGNLDLTDLSKKTGKFSVYLNHIDVDAYLHLMGNTQDQAVKTRGNAQPNTGAIALPPVIKSYNIAGNISAKDLTAGKIHFDSLETQLVSNYGFINLYPLSANLYRGKLSGALSADFRPLQAIFDTRLSLESVDLQPLLSDVLNFKGASGELNVKTNLTTHGADTQTLKQHLNGQATIHLVNGALNNIDLAYYYQSGLALLRGQKPSVIKTNTTSIGSLNGTFNIENGIASNNDLSLTSHDFTVTGSGTVNLPANTLNYLLHVNDKQGNTIPLIVSGQLTSPSIKPDLSQVIKQTAEKQLKSKLQNALKNLSF